MICQNFKSQADQLTERLNKEDFDPEIEQYCEDNPDWKVFVLHGNKDKSKDPESYVYSIVNKCKKDIIWLSNKTRLKLLAKHNSLLELI